MRAISDKQQNWIIFVVWSIVMCIVIKIIILICDGMKAAYPKHTSETEYWVLFTVFCVMGSVISTAIANILVEWLGPEIRIEDRIKKAKEIVAEHERELNDAQHILNELESQRNKRVVAGDD